MRTEFELRHFVVGVNGPVQRRMLRCLEALETARGTALVPSGPTEKDLLERILLDLEKEAGEPFSWERLEAEEPGFWRKALQAQAIHDVNATGRISVPTQERFAMAGMGPPPGRDYIKEVENRLVHGDKKKIFVAIPTAKKHDEVKPGEFDHLTNWHWPTDECEFTRQVLAGYPVDEAYEHAVHMAFEQGADFMLCIEDDHEIPDGVFYKLWDLYRQKGPRAIVGAYYKRRTPPHNGVHVAVDHGHRKELDADGRVHEVYIIAQGFTLIPMQVFRELPQPWFRVTPLLTQDAFFSQLARDIGYSLWVDTSARIFHIDRKSGLRIF